MLEIDNVKYGISGDGKYNIPLSCGNCYHIVTQDEVLNNNQDTANICTQCSHTLYNNKLIDRYSKKLLLSVSVCIIFIINLILYFLNIPPRFNVIIVSLVVAFTLYIVNNNLKQSSIAGAIFLILYSHVFYEVAPSMEDYVLVATLYGIFALLIGSLKYFYKSTNKQKVEQLILSDMNYRFDLIKTLNPKQIEELIISTRHCELYFHALNNNVIDAYMFDEVWLRGNVSYKSIKELYVSNMIHPNSARDKVFKQLENNFYQGTAQDARDVGIISLEDYLALLEINNQRLARLSEIEKEKRQRRMQKEERKRHNRQIRNQNRQTQLLFIWFLYK